MIYGEGNQMEGENKAIEDIGRGRNDEAQVTKSANKVAVSKFDPKMKTAQIAALEKNWKAFKSFFQNDPQALIETFDLTLNTAILISTRSNNPKLLTELLDMLPNPADRWRALRIGNSHKNTILHHIIHCWNVKMVDAVLQYNEKLNPPEDEGIKREEKTLSLLDLGNDVGETPVYRAAKYGKLKILKQMAKYVDDMEKHFHRRDGTSILHIAIIGQYFDVAMWLSKVDKLVHETDGNELTCLQLLSRMPSAFRSNISHMEFFEKLIYNFLPEQEYEDFDNDMALKQGTDLESRKENTNTISGSSRINYAFWKFIAKEYDGIDRIWKTKKQHRLAKQLADFLVPKDNSWQNTCHAKPRKMVVLPVIQPSNVAAQKKSRLEKSQSHEHPIHSSVYTPLLLAASTGIVEIVEKIIEENPEAIAHVSPEDNQNVLHVVVKHRQRRIYNILRDYGALRQLASQMGNKNRTLLHQVARMDYYSGGSKAGVVFQLQDELRWFERVKKILPPPYILYCNEDKLTAKELFDIEHADMLKEAQDWIKGTAQSCSAVAVLVATVVFAAAYTIPGGTNNNGIPVFLNSPLFLFFTVTDIVALACSLVSVMMFLSILTSPFEMKDFLKSLPRKLSLGFTLLFFSLMNTTLAFGSTILLTIGMQKEKETSGLIYSVTFFPVTIFGLMQFPIYMAVKHRLKRISKSCKRLLPSRFTISKKGIKRNYSKHA